ncbi:ComF family protein [Prevotella sp. S7 MS 2]|uniref:ComF family protein n=1 Tax=Prevotella sp. S7 MS 2 TaxID=1287488 RepID=UPI000513CFA0|nr:ComF family protein [Prevotella sp. S7 MS 2]KGI61292.1 competence protein ComF [Prevotella sp. S7 MS 2]
MSRWSDWGKALLDVIAPRCCAVCGRRLSVDEQVMCGRCNLHLPRTGFELQPYDNEMAKMFWGLIPVERCVAFFYYTSHAPESRLIYDLKYHHHPEIGYQLGHMLARDCMQAGFFEGIDMIIPIPLYKKRERQRGYNQSVEIARGVAEATGLPLKKDVVERITFGGSQTLRDRWQRTENVEDAFRLKDTSITGHHILLIDDIVTTGATICSCAQELLRAGNVKFSVLCLGLANRE